VNLTTGAQRALRRSLTVEDALPTRMPVYVNSIAYLFGATALMSFVLLIVSGVLLALGGPFWYHTNSVGRFFDYIHFWGVQIFFAALFAHLATKFFLGAWRGGRWATWVAGALLLAAAIFTGLTGYLLQTNWDSQWIATQAKDAMNAAGIGALFNTMNTGQVLMLHTVVMPLVVAAIIGLHLFLVRRDSPVRPYDD
jgi:quinol-cytochrome oxidoreductase complex cytochrome b subunit